MFPRNVNRAVINIRVNNNLLAGLDVYVITINSVAGSQYHSGGGHFHKLIYKACRVIRRCFQKDLVIVRIALFGSHLRLNINSIIIVIGGFRYQFDAIKQQTGRLAGEQRLGPIGPAVRIHNPILADRLIHLDPLIHCDDCRVTGRPCVIPPSVGIQRVEVFRAGVVYIIFAVGVFLTPLISRRGEIIFLPPRGPFPVGMIYVVVIRIVRRPRTDVVNISGAVSVNGYGLVYVGIIFYTRSPTDLHIL
jgi:hypothetical protein